MLGAARGDSTFVINYSSLFHPELPFPFCCFYRLCLINQSPPKCCLVSYFFCSFLFGSLQPTRKKPFGSCAKRKVLDSFSLLQHLSLLTKT